MNQLTKLKKRVEANREQRARDEARHKLLTERRKEVDTAAAHTIYAFWCKRCKKDFSWHSDKVIAEYKTWPIAWYVSVHPPCGEKSIRYITDKHIDPYYFESEDVKRLQRQHADDFLTPDDQRFRTVYPAQWARLQEEKRNREEQLFKT